MKYTYGPIGGLTQVQLLDARIGCKTQTEVLKNLGYSTSGQNRKRLKACAAELGVELPGRPRQLVPQDEPTTGPLPPGQRATFVDVPGGQAVLPPSRGIPCSQEAFNEAQEDVGVYTSIVSADKLRPYGFQDTIDELETEIENFQAEIDKRRAIQTGLRALDE